MSITAPAFVVLETETACWACKATTLVVALGVAGYTCDDEDGPGFDPAEGALLGYVTDLNYEAIDWIRARAPGYRKDFTAAAGHEYWLNHCTHCDAKQGDHFLKSEPDGAFFPTTDEGLTRIRTILVETPLEADAGLSSGVCDDLVVQALSIAPPSAASNSK